LERADAFVAFERDVVLRPVDFARTTLPCDARPRLRPFFTTRAGSGVGSGDGDATSSASHRTVSMYASEWL
jgi:hypothetical protein